MAHPRYLVPARGPPSRPRPHPRGYMVYNSTRVLCDNCTLATLARTTVRECEGCCNGTAGCTAFEAAALECRLLSAAGPGGPDPRLATYVRVPDEVPFELR